MDMVDIASGNDQQFAIGAMAIEIVSFPKNGDFQQLFACLAEGSGGFLSK